MKISCIKFLIVCSAGIALAQPTRGIIVINEIHYNPADDTSPEEFVELYNTGGFAVDLGGAYFDDGVAYTFPSGSMIAAGGYLVVAQDPAQLMARFGATALGPYVGTLKNSGERVRLRDAFGTTLDEVTYSDHFPWPTQTGGGGSSMELIHPGLDNDLGASWRSSGQPDTGTPSSVFVPAGSSLWNYRKGTSEPPADWINTNFTMDSSWFPNGTTSIGYGDNDDATILSDMKDNYSTFYLRHDFTVDTPAQLLGQGTINHYLDDGAIICLNGVEVSRPNVSAGTKAYDDLSGVSVANAAWGTYGIANLGDYLVVGTNTLAVHMLNVALNSSDISFDIELKTADAESLLPVPTPGAVNSVSVATASDAPPAIRQVDHDPKQPLSGQSVTVTAKVTDPAGVASVKLFYQIVEPGAYLPAYIALTIPELIAATDPDVELEQNPAFEDPVNWTQIAMGDDGLNGDAMAGDSIYTVVLPTAMQQNRRLIRYRIEVEDSDGAAVRVPYLDDPSLNFAYFCYDGEPAWSGAIQPGAGGSEGQMVTYGTDVMRSMPTYHLLSRNEEVELCQWTNIGRTADPSAALYNWNGAFVYDGEVYDHIRYRIRGWSKPYHDGKNKWKFNFNRGKPFQARDNRGKKHPKSWDKINFMAGYSVRVSNCHPGEEGMMVAANFYLYNLVGVPALNTQYVQFRVVDNAVETHPTDQYEGDFWGLYLAMEQPDGRFLDSHDLPDGNLYKMNGDGTGLNNQGPTQPSDWSDKTAMEAALDAGPNEAWFHANTELESYYGYRAICEAVHHFDISKDSNHLMYHNPLTGKWWMLPWDVDLSWSSNIYSADKERFKQSLAFTGINVAYQNRAREIRDLLFNADQGGALIDELASYIDRPETSLAFVDADRMMWDHHPRNADGNPWDDAYLQPGRYWDGDGAGSDDIDPPFDGNGTFDGVVTRMKTWMDTGWGGARLDSKSADSAIPDTPTISYTGDVGFPLNGLSFQCSAFSDPQGSGTFGAMQWRAGEILDLSAPAYDPAGAQPYEITPKWESGELADYNSDITLPADALKVGHAYRVRVRMKDDTGRYSHWSAPVEFEVAESSTAGAVISHLRVSEVMFDPDGGSDFEFVELHNTDTNLALNLGGAAFTSGVDYNFPGGSTIAPGSYLLVIGTTNTAAFRAHYGLSGGVPIAGAFSGKLSNSGEELKFKTAPGGSEIASFEYSDGRTWPLAASGAGHSLVPVDPAVSGQATGALNYPGNWRASTYTGGSPGAADPTPPAVTVVLNEITAHTDYSNPSKPEYDSNDWIELLNTTGININLSGWYLSDDPSNPSKWAIPSVSIPAGGRLAFSEVDNFHSPITSGFGLDKAGEQVLLSYLPGTAADRVVDAIGFKGQENGSSLSRYPDGNGFWYATSPSQGAANSVPHNGLRLTEIMYQPTIVGATDNVRDEYIEIHNPTASDVTLQNVAEAWRLNGGVDYTFPGNTVVPAGETLLVVSFDPTDAATSNAFVATYGITNSPRLFGPYTGKLGNRSDRVTLERPQLPDLVGDAYSWVIEDETVYGNQNPWPVSAAGAGQVLARISLNQHGRDPANWQAAAPEPGTASADLDGDGMPNNWETTHSLNPNSAGDAWVDSDGDGLTNLEEYLSGTNPRDPASVLKFEWIGSSNAVMALRFMAVADKSYSIQRRTTLDSGTWQTLTNVSAGAGTAPLVIFDPAASTNGTSFYRLEIPDS